ncbi:Cwf15/Cwc15 cell cycle control protein [Lactarius hengduanensis]|nr:Cwf15/Cwc15 cell cycle control protein [Lactarius hengduanensis]
MSTAHRPTWDPAQAREVKGGSRPYFVRDMAAHTKLKFRQTSVDEVKKRDLRADLLAAEGEARAKKRKAAGLPVEDTPVASEDEEATKRRKVLQEALEMDKDADSDEGEAMAMAMAMARTVRRGMQTEQARVEQAEAEATEAEREARIATANPLLNLAAALGNAPGIITTAPGTFAVKRRLGRRSAIGDKDKPQGPFVDDLLRTEFHKLGVQFFRNQRVESRFVYQLPPQENLKVFYVPPQPL